MEGDSTSYSSQCDPIFYPIKSNFLIKVNFVDLNTAEELTQYND